MPRAGQRPEVPPPLAAPRAPRSNPRRPGRRAERPREPEETDADTRPVAGPFGQLRLPLPTLASPLSGGARPERLPATMPGGPPRPVNHGTHRMSPDVLSQLAPTGVLRAGINLSNFLL